MIWVVIILYSLPLLYIFLFSLGQLHLAWVYVRKPATEVAPRQPLVFFPSVTIQLPVYNEKYVVERLLDAVAAIDYPADRLEVQVLDDSTDETTSLIAKKITTLRKDLNLRHIIRTNREGFKAGALQNGMGVAQGEFIAIFDADFLPQPDFLKKTIPHFADSHIGAVQTRWGHLNRDYSLLTQLQAFGLDAHFSIEQTARHQSGSFINFNGTCGIWRKKCIEEAGGWSADTLTEDLDLSYRAQLKGWRFQYLEEVETPGELPVIMPAVKSQQYRWNKGAAETARKVFWDVLRSENPWKHKIHAFFHLFNSSVFVCLLLAALLSVPMLLIHQQHPELQVFFTAGSVLFGGFLSITFFYWISSRRTSTQPLRTFLSLYPRFLIVSMGLSLHNGLAVLEGLLGRETPFIRTPKFNVVKKGDTWQGNQYVSTMPSLQTWLEGLLFVYFSGALVLGYRWGDATFALFHSLLALGFGSVFYFSLKPHFK